MCLCRVMIVEDEAIAASNIEQQLIATGYQVVGIADNGAQALELAKDHRPDVVLMDIVLQGTMDGITTAEEITRQFNIPIIFLTAHSDEKTLDRAKFAEPYGYILKPFDKRELKSAIEIALYKHRSEEEIRRFKRLYEVQRHITHRIAGSQSREELLEGVCRVIVELGGIDLSWIGQFDKGTSAVIPIAYFGTHGDLLIPLEESKEGGRNYDIGKLSHAARAGRSYICNDCSRDDCVEFSVCGCSRFGFGSWGVFPFRSRGEICGALYLGKIEGDFFRSNEVDLLSSIAIHISSGLDKIDADACREQAETTLHDREELLHLFIEHAPAALAMFDENMRYLSVSRRWKDDFKLGNQPIIGLSHYNIFPEISERIKEVHRRCLAGEVFSEESDRFERADGSTQWLRWDTRPWRGKDGKIAGIVIFSEDITQRKETMESLRQSEECYRSLVLASSDLVWETDTKGRYTYVSPMIQEIFGYSQQEVIGRCIFDFMPVDEAHRVKTIFSSPIQGSFSHFENINLHKNGRRVVLKTSGAPIFGAEGELLGYRGMTRDITERKQAEKELQEYRNQLEERVEERTTELTAKNAELVKEIEDRKQAEKRLRLSEEKYRMLVETTSDCIWAVDPQGHFTYLSPNFENLVGYNPINFIGHSPMELVSNDEGCQIAKRFNAILGTRQAFSLAEHFYRHRDGRLVAVEVRGVPFFNTQGEYKGMRGITRDTTARMKAVEALRLHLAVMETVTEGIFFIGVDDNVIKWANCELEEMFGYDPNELIGMDVSVLNAPTDNCPTEIRDSILSITLEIGEWYGEIKNIKKDGTHFWSRVHVSLFDHPEFGRVMVSAHTDITQSKQAEETLHRLNETLEQQVTERTMLAETRAKQLQALAVELIESEESERRRFAQLLHDDLQQMLASARLQLSSANADLENQVIIQRVDQILEESISKSRRLAHDLSPVVLHRSSFFSALDWLAGQMNEQFGLEVELLDENSPQIQNPTLKVFLFRAVQELLFNIIKHAGVKSAAVVISGSNGNVKVTVSDTGKGFNKEILDSAHATTFGLLSIRERASYFGGQLEIESKPSQGTNFILTVPTQAISGEIVHPIAEEPYPAVEEKASYPDSKLRVLFADDHKVIRQALVRLISSQPDIQVIGEAANGKEAVDLSMLLHPDVIVMDIAMPVMDGIQATQRIKSELPDVRVIGLSTFEDEKNIQDMLKSGAEAFVSKTASSSELLRAVYGNR
jgi:PAS domain S-box-containing protein